MSRGPGFHMNSGNVSDIGAIVLTFKSSKKCCRLHSASRIMLLGLCVMRKHNEKIVPDNFKDLKVKDRGWQKRTDAAQTVKLNAWE